MENLGFTVSADMMAHLSVMQSFEESESVIRPHFFTNKHAAINFFSEEVKRTPRILDFKVREFEKISKVDITLNSELLPKVVSTLKNIEKEEQFVKKHSLNFNSLSKREKQVLKLIVNNFDAKEIAKLLLISINTVSTHRKNLSLIHI